LSVLRNKVVEIITPDLTAKGIDLVDVELAGNAGKMLVRLYIDKLGETQDKCTLSIADCEKISRAVEQLLNVEDILPKNFTLEVSTPGLERPVRTLDEFRRFKSKLAQITSDSVSGGVLVGRIKDVDGNSVVMDVDGKEQKINMDQIKRSKLKFER